MKSNIMALLIIISFLFVAGHTNARFLKDNNLFIGPDGISVVVPGANSLVDDKSSLQTANGNMVKDPLGCVQEILNPRSDRSSKSAANKKSLSFRLNPTVPTTLKMESSASSNKAEGVNSMVTEQRLSTSSNSPGVGHMQINHHNSQSRNVNVMKSHHSNADDHLQQKKSNKRKLGSTPSPGDGH